MSEQWADAVYIGDDGTVTEFPGYKVSSLGRVKSWRGQSDGRVLKPHLPGNGYVQYGLSLPGGDQKWVLAHRLVLSSFKSEEWFPGALTCHGSDEDRSDNRLENLSWGTASENHYQKHRRDGNYIGIDNANAEVPAEIIQKLLDKIDAGHFPSPRGAKYSSTEAARWLESTYGCKTTKSTVRKWYNGTSRFDVRRNINEPIE